MTITSLLRVLKLMRASNQARSRQPSTKTKTKRHSLISKRRVWYQILPLPKKGRQVLPKACGRKKTWNNPMESTNSKNNAGAWESDMKNHRKRSQSQAVSLESVITPPDHLNPRKQPRKHPQITKRTRVHLKINLKKGRKKIEETDEVSNSDQWKIKWIWKRPHEMIKHSAKSDLNSCNN